jgi:hypothetical protein
MALRLMLFCAAVRDSQAFPLKKASQLVRKALKNPRAKSWPGPLGLFVLREISEAQAREEGKSCHPLAKRRHLNQVEFYAGILASQDGEKKKFRMRMRRCVDQGRYLLNDEWHLARFEVANG